MKYFDYARIPTYTVVEDMRVSKFLSQTGACHVVKIEELIFSVVEIGAELADASLHCAYSVLREPQQVHRFCTSPPLTKKWPSALMGSGVVLKKYRRAEN